MLGVLRRMGQQDVTTAVNGLEALEVMQARGGADAFDLVLMDLHMPIMVRAHTLTPHPGHMDSEPQALNPTPWTHPGHMDSEPHTLKS